ncbi:integrator complex subunit 2-like [Asterias amurensis]|uniref:integrator complex subunit 2-like n=1 Tax=Asterias amurensis TaxID=7602 RepID=UPI003AB8376D
MSQRFELSSEAFEAIQNVDIERIANMDEASIRALLPCLVRMSLCAPLDVSQSWVEGRKQILRVLSGLEVVNSIVALLSVDFNALEQDARKELQMRHKLGETENLLTANIQHGLALEFERSDPARRLRLLISELLFISSQIKDTTDFVRRPCELFESEVYLEEVSDVLCIAQAELPSLLSIEKMAEAVLRVQYGPTLLCRLVANVPDSFFQVCRRLIVNGERQDEESYGGRRRTQTLRMLATMNPSQSLTIRALTVEQCKLPGLAVALSLDHNTTNQSDSRLSEVIGFVSGLLLGSNSAVRNWFAHFVRNGQKNKGESTSSILHALRTHLLEQLTSLCPSEEFHGNLPERQVVQASAVMRLYCSLKGIAGLKFSDEEAHQLLRLLSSHPPSTPSGIRFICLGLCMLIACPSLIRHFNQDDEAVVIQWLNWLVKEGSRFERESGISASFSEMLLLMASHFHSNQVHAIIDLVCSTLGMKIPIRPNSLARVRLLFMQEVFTEQVVTAHAVTVAVTPDLSGSISGYLPIHCVYNLLQSKAFAKHKVPIKDWIFKQICHSAPPLHSLFPPLLEAYVSSVVVSTQQFRIEPLTEREILSVYQTSNVSLLRASVCQEGGLRTEGKSGLTAQLLMLYYLLLYEDCVLSNMKILVMNNQRPQSYSNKLTSQMPIKYLLHEAQRQQPAYAGLYPSLLRLLATHYPHLCLVEDWLGEELTEEEMGVRKKRKMGGADGETGTAKCTPQRLQNALKHAVDDPSESLILLRHLCRLEPHHLMDFAEVLVASLPGQLEEGVPLQVTSLAVKLWRMLNTVMLRRLRVMTVNALVCTTPVVAFTEEDITLDPLIVLRCDLRVFRCPPILDIVMQMLTAYLAASRAFLTSHLQSSPSIIRRPEQGLTPLPTKPEREELKNALISAQESTAVQLLLEICLPFENEKKVESKLSALREVQCQVCSQLHQMFIIDPNLAKLIHFQGYPSELLPITVAGIPSMHICLDFIPELLSQPQTDKQIFAIELVSHLCLQFALPKSLSVARLAVNVMSTLLTVLPSEKLCQFFLPTLPSLVRICQAFPPMYEDVTSLLTQIGRMCISRMATVNSPMATGLDSSSAGLFMAKDRQCLPEHLNLRNSDRVLHMAVENTFRDIVKLAVVNKKVF